VKKSKEISEGEIINQIQKKETYETPPKKPRTMTSNEIREFFKDKNNQTELGFNQFTIKQLQNYCLINGWDTTMCKKKDVLVQLISRNLGFD